MPYDFSMDGFGELLQELDREPDVEMRNYRIRDYAEEALHSWQYQADAQFRQLVDLQLAVQQRLEAVQAPLAALQLQLQLLEDDAEQFRREWAANGMQPEGLKSVAPILEKFRVAFSSAYASGIRNAQVTGMLMAMIRADKAKGSMNPAEYPGLKPGDFEALGG